jgi:hypothetical protein
MVSWCGIDPNPEKVSAITKLAPPESLHDIQKLMGCVVTLSSFFSRLGIRGLPFFKLLKKHDKLQWPKEAHEAFVVLKKYLTTPTRPSGPKTPRNLAALHIISATSNVVSTMIIIE